MDKILFMIRLFLFFLSCYGYIQDLRRFARIEFCIGLLFSGISCVLFFAGILNLLRAAAWALFLFGLILAANSVKQRNRAHGILCAGTVFFLLLLVLFRVYSVLSSAVKVIVKPFSVIEGTTI